MTVHSLKSHLPYRTAKVASKRLLLASIHYGTLLFDYLFNLIEQS